jgi:hypothetical protein
MNPFGIGARNLLRRTERMWCDKTPFTRTLLPAKPHAC